MDEVRVLAPNGMLGTGFPEASLKSGMSWDPHYIAVDAGSTDSGPADLGAGTCRYSRRAYARDLKLILGAARAQGVPLIIGSAGGAGGRANVDWTKEILLDAARELGLSFKLAVIYSDQDKTYLHDRLRAGDIRELGGVAPLTADTIDQSQNIVGMMGAEPIMQALQSDADVILAGRSSDTAIFAAFPLLQGQEPGPVWHAAKILECGAAAVEYRPSPDSMFAWLRGDHFVVRAPNPALRCTPISVAAHALYENGNPYRITEPSGTLELSGAAYEQLPDGAVRVTGSQFETADAYTVKLEGAELVGYQTVSIGGIADPTLLADLDNFLALTLGRTAERVARTYGELPADSWTVRYRVYGQGKTVQLGEAAAPPPIGPDVGVVIETIANTQELANGIASTARHQLLHQPVPHWKGFVSNYALAYGGTDLVRGPVYRFNMNCVVKPANPLEMFDLHLEQVRGG